MKVDFLNNGYAETELCVCGMRGWIISYGALLSLSKGFEKLWVINLSLSWCTQENLFVADLNSGPWIFLMHEGFFFF